MDITVQTCGGDTVAISFFPGENDRTDVALTLQDAIDLQSKLSTAIKFLSE